MKINFNILKMLVLSFILFSCSKDNDNQPSKELTATDIAQYHNEVVDLYIKSKEENNQKRDLIEIKNHMITLFTEKHPDLMKNFKEPNDDFNFVSLKYVAKSDKGNYFDLKTFIDEVMDKVVAKGKLSKSFADNIKKIANEEMTYEQMKKEISAIKKTQLSSEESKFIEVFDKVSNASHQYWTSRKKITTRGIFGLSDSSSVIMGDAVGAAVGLYGTPLWSIIQGGLVSVAMNEGYGL